MNVPYSGAATFSPERMRDRRLHLGYTQRELAERVGVTQAAIAKWEKGGTERPALLRELSDALLCPESWLLGVENTAPNDTYHENLTQIVQVICSIAAEVYDKQGKLDDLRDPKSEDKFWPKGALMLDTCINVLRSGDLERLDRLLKSMEQKPRLSNPFEKD